MKLAHLPLLLSAFAALLSLSTIASAQSLSINKAAITRDAPMRDSSHYPYMISRADCLFNGTGDVLHVPITYSNDRDSSLQVWVTSLGYDCGPAVNRLSTSASCWKVYDNALSGTGAIVDLRAQDIAGRRYPSISPNGPNSATPAECAQDDGASMTVVQLLSIQFFFVPSGSSPFADLTVAATFEDSGYDLLGPPAPTNVRMSTAGSSLLNWDENTFVDVAGFSLFADPPASSNQTSAQSAHFFNPPIDSGVEDAASNNGKDAGSCSSSSLQSGILPDSKFRNGPLLPSTATGADPVSLQLDQPYTLGVASVDLVGNAGPISETVCAIRHPIQQSPGSSPQGSCAVRNALGSPFFPKFISLLTLSAAICAVRRRRQSPLAKSGKDSS